MDHHDFQVSPPSPFRQELEMVIHQNIPINRKAEAPLRLRQSVKEMNTVCIVLEQIAPFRTAIYDVVYAIRNIHSYRV